MKSRYSLFRCLAPRASAAISTLFLTICCSSVWAVDWDGSESVDWNDPLNWPGDAVPDGASVGVQSAAGNIATISADSTFSPSEVIIGGWFATGRLDHTAGMLATQNVGWPPGWMLVGFGATGNATYNLADTAAAGGTFTGFGTGSGSLNCVDAFFVGEPGGSNDGTGVGTVNVNTSGSLSVAFDLFLGVSGWTGNMNVDAGTVTSNNIHVGKTNNANPTAGVGNLSIGGGAVATNYRLNIGAGDMTVATSGNVGTVTLAGGSLTTDAATDDFWAAGVNMASGAWDGVNGSGIGGTGGTATFHLDGGTLSTLWVFSESPVDNMGTPEDSGDDVTYANGTSTFNFNGGTLQAQTNMDAPWLPFMGNLTNAFVKAGGAVIDSNGFNVLVSQPLLEDSGSPGGGLTKLGGGQLELTASGTYTGEVVVEEGTLFANSGNAPNDRVFSYATSVTVKSGAILRANANSLFGWDGSQAKPLIVEAGATAVAENSDQNVGLVTLNGGTLASVNPAADWGSWNFGRSFGGGLMVTDDSLVSAEGVGFVEGAEVTVEPGKTLTFSGTIIDKPDAISSIRKWGDGTMVLSGANTYSGMTWVAEGTLSMADATLADSADVTIDESYGALLELNHSVVDTVRGLWIDDVEMDPGIYRSADGSGDGTVLSALAGTGKLLVLGSSASGYGDWADIHVGGQTADQDFNFDGTPNGVAYFMNATTGFVSNPMPDGTNTVTWPNGGNIPASAYGSQYVIQISSNLVDWTEVLAGDLAGNTDGPGGAVSYTIVGTGSRFVRLSVTPD